jgi:hypothetical protein
MGQESSGGNPKPTSSATRCLDKEEEGQVLNYQFWSVFTKRWVHLREVKGVI